MGSGEWHGGHRDMTNTEQSKSRVASKCIDCRKEEVVKDAIRLEESLRHGLVPPDSRCPDSFTKGWSFQ